MEEAKKKTEEYYRKCIQPFLAPPDGLRHPLMLACDCTAIDGFGLDSGATATLEAVFGLMRSDGREIMDAKLSYEPGGAWSPGVAHVLVLYR